MIPYTIPYHLMVPSNNEQHQKTVEACNGYVLQHNLCENIFFNSYTIIIMILFTIVALMLCGMVA